MRQYRAFIGSLVLCIALIGLSSAFLSQRVVGAFSSNWVSTTRLPREIANFAVVSNQQIIYVIGGGLTPPVLGASPPPIRDVYYARILPNGSLSAWSLTTSLPDPLAGHAAASKGSTIYVIGGFNGGSLSRDTFYANIQPDGSLSSWTRSDSKLPIGLSAHDVNVRGEYIYVIGGFDVATQSSLKSVYRARILAGGDIGDWERLLDMAQSTYRHTSEIYGDKLYVIGGREGHGSAITPLNSVYIGQFDSDGEIVNWTATEFLPQNLYFHGSVLSKDEKKIYTFGGFNGNSATNKVYSCNAPQKLDR